ncbi:MAG: hypothetical protein PHG25_03140 [Candidatus Pacebacteria bacterium]|nr:hypothetical protein [Candidatus Paceibacterota bacterium]
MEHLTKQQIVLLTLLVSFITSLSTGIVTVSLMDQAPAVTHTVNQIIEKTIQSSPQNASVGTISISVDDQIVKATALVASSTVKIKITNTNTIVGLGLILTKNGLIVTSKNIIDQNQSYSAVLADGTTISLMQNSLYPTQLSYQHLGSVIFFTPITNLNNGLPITFTPINAGNTYALGQKIFTLTSTSSALLKDGLINQVSDTSISTSISSSNSVLGSPLFDIQGNIIGIQTSIADGQGISSFYPIAPLIRGSSVL